MVLGHALLIQPATKSPLEVSLFVDLAIMLTCILPSNVPRLPCQPSLPSRFRERPGASHMRSFPMPVSYPVIRSVAWPYTKPPALVLAPMVYLDQQRTILRGR